MAAPVAAKAPVSVIDASVDWERFFGEDPSPLPGAVRAQVHSRPPSASHARAAAALVESTSRVRLGRAGCESRAHVATAAEAPVRTATTAATALLRRRARAARPTPKPGAANCARVEWPRAAPSRTRPRLTTYPLVPSGR